MSIRQHLLRLSASAVLIAAALVSTTSPATAATSWSGSKNCGSSYVQIQFSAATGSYSAIAYEHLDFGTSSYTVHRNYEIQAYYIGYVVRTELHSVNWSIYIIGSAQTKTPTTTCISAPIAYGTQVTKSGSKNCGSARVSLVPNAYSFLISVVWTGSSPTSAGSRVYFPVFASRYSFLAWTGEHSITWSVTARGEMPKPGGGGVSPVTLNSVGATCY